MQRIFNRCSRGQSAGTDVPYFGIRFKKPRRQHRPSILLMNRMQSLLCSKLSLSVSERGKNESRFIHCRPSGSYVQRVNQPGRKSTHDAWYDSVISLSSTRSDTQCKMMTFHPCFSQPILNLGALLPEKKWLSKWRDFRWCSFWPWPWPLQEWVMCRAHPTNGT